MCPIFPSLSGSGRLWFGHYAEALRRVTHVPTTRLMRNAATLTNANVVASGQSATTIKHPTLPICILGYAHGGGGGGGTARRD